MISNLSQLYSWLTFENSLRLSTAILSSFAIFVLQLYFLRKRPATNLDTKPASFFEIDELASETRLRILTTFYALPGAALFLVIALTAKPFIDAAKDFLSIQVAGSVGGEQAKQSIENLLKLVPDWLNPALVLVITVLLFSPYIRKPFELLRTLVLFAIGIEARANRFAIQAAKIALDKKDLDNIQDKLKKEFGKTPPLPEELVASSDTIKLAYQILFFSADSIKTIGLRDAIDLTLKTIGVEAAQRPPQSLMRYSDLLAAFTFYFVLCIAYVFIAPLAAPLLQSDPTLKSLLQVIEWPQTPGALALSIAQRTFSFVAPLAFGMHYYANHDARTDSFSRTSQRIGIVFSWQFLASALLNFLFIGLMILKRRSNEFHDALISLGDTKIWADIFTSSLAPGLALAAWVACSRLKQRWLAYLALCLTAGAAFCFGQFAYEGISREWRGYYWHELALGVFLTVSYLCGALIARDAVSLSSETPTVKATEATLRPSKA